MRKFPVVELHEFYSLPLYDVLLLSSPGSPTFNLLAAENLGHGAQDKGGRGHREASMAIQAQIKPAAWGAAGGAVAAMIIGFAWGGWVTGGTSEKAAGTAARTAVVQNFVPLCVTKAEQQPDQLALLKKESSYRRTEFVIKAGWVESVTEKYRRNVAEQCASTIVEAMDAAAAKKS